MITLFPEGFEETEEGERTEFVAYTDAAGEDRFRTVFAAARSEPVEGGWEDRWREFHRPIRAGPFWIGPPWLEPPGDALPVVIDPGRAFGTGAHATTRLCLELLAEQPRGSLVDIGCGSGVLAIAAAKLGFAPVIAIDRDEVAVSAAGSNASENDVVVEVRAGDALEERLPRADLAVANVDAQVVRELAPRLECGRLIASGYYWSERPELTGFRHRERRTDERWAADVWERE